MTAVTHHLRAIAAILALSLAGFRSAPPTRSSSRPHSSI
jgi:hypothetical protein